MRYVSASFFTLLFYFTDNRNTAITVTGMGMAEIAGADIDGVNRRGGHCRSKQ